MSRAPGRKRAQGGPRAAETLPEGAVQPGLFDDVTTATLACVCGHRTTGILPGTARHLCGRCLALPLHLGNGPHECELEPVVVEL